MFPISYFFNDVLTEVYGYSRSRKVVWAGFTALIFASIMSAVVVGLPPAPGWIHQEAYRIVFGQTPRIVIASLSAFFCGEFANSFVLAKMKILTKGRWLWSRTRASRSSDSTSAQAQPWSPSPMQPPPVRGWLASGHVKAVLGGEGADELFAGYAHLQAGSDRLYRWRRTGWPSTEPRAP